MNPDVCLASTSGGARYKHTYPQAVSFCVFIRVKEMFGYLLLHVLIVSLYTYDKCNVDLTETLGFIWVH